MNNEYTIDNNPNNSKKSLDSHLKQFNIFNLVNVFTNKNINEYGNAKLILDTHNIINTIIDDIPYNI